MHTNPDQENPMPAVLSRRRLLTGAKVVARRMLPSAAVQTVRDGWEDFRDWIAVVTFGVRFVATRSPRPRVLLYFGFAAGDDLLCTAVLRELRRRDRGGFLMVSDHRELFIGNSDPAYVRPLWERYYPDGSTVAICRRFVKIWGGQFTRLEYAPLDGADSRTPPSR